MEAIVTARMDAGTKLRASEVLEREGLSSSEAIRLFFEETVRRGSLPFQREGRPERSELIRRIAAFDACRAKGMGNMTDEQLRNARMKDRYGLDD